MLLLNLMKKTFDAHKEGRPWIFVYFLKMGFSGRGLDIHIYLLFGTQGNLSFIKSVLNLHLKQIIKLQFNVCEQEIMIFELKVSRKDMKLYNSVFKIYYILAAITMSIS